MQYHCGWQRAVAGPRRRGKPVPELVGRGRIHAVVPTGVLALCGTPIVHREDRRFDPQQRGVCSMCRVIVAG